MDFDTPGVVELRRYTLRPGRRDDLVSLFEREFVETQEALGADLLGMFTDDDDPDRFVWLRGFADMASRRRMLTAFYGGPTWAEHRDAANATMVDSDDVLLLRPGVVAPIPPRLPASTPTGPRSRAAVTVWDRGDRVEAAIDERLRPAVERSGGAVLAVLVTEPSPNDHPALPVREDVSVVVVVSRVDDREAYDRIVAEYVPGGTTDHLIPTPRSLWP